MWEKARSDVADMFFKDVIDIYENTYVTSPVGESLEQPFLLYSGVKCNVQNGQSALKDVESGQTAPQTLRISLSKGVALSYGKTYRVKIISARISHTTEFWNVDGWTEAQISTVLAVSRRVSV